MSATSGIYRPIVPDVIPESVPYPTPDPRHVYGQPASHYQQTDQKTIDDAAREVYGTSNPETRRRVIARGIFNK